MHKRTLGIRSLEVSALGFGCMGLSRAAGTANQTKISGAPVKGPVFEFAPVINQFLQTHLFGDIFERDNLDWQSRELATVGALAATPGVEPQLRAHMAASLRVGLSAAQLGEVTEQLKKHEDAQTAERANAALKEVLAASKK
jgi:alkylhydroperoxidase/carboxymuconolactone decarboxylase family protein YurZ